MLNPAVCTGSTVCDVDPTSPDTSVVPPELLVMDVPARTAKLAALPKLILATGAAVTVKLVVTVCAP